MNKLLEITVISIAAVALISAVVTAASFSITVTSPSGGTVINPVQVTGTVSATSFVGQLSQYTVSIDWNDSSAVTTLNQTGNHLNLTESAGDFSGTFSTDPDLGHTFTDGEHVFSVFLCHQACSGHEGADSVQTLTVNVITPTCTLSANPLSSFGSLNPNDISSDQFTTLTNTGTVTTTSLTIQGADWTDGVSHTIPVAQTHWSLSPITTYGTGDNILSSSAVSLGVNLVSSASQDVHFRVQVPAGQFPSSYTQAITFTAGC